MFCIQCGKEIAVSAKFCPACGNAVAGGLSGTHNVPDQPKRQSDAAITVELINRAKQKDQDAIAKVYHQSYKLAFFLAKQIVRSDDEAMDVLQDSYIKAFAKLELLESPEKFQGWLNRIVSNQAKDYLKKKKAILFTDLAGEDGAELEFEDEREIIAPEQVVEREETKRLLMEILDGLSEEQRLVTMMFYYEELSVKEIAKDLECSENTVKSRLNYARQKIKEQVLNLEKKGTKLYGVAPISFFIWMLTASSSEAALPNAEAENLLRNILQKNQKIPESMSQKTMEKAVGDGAKSAASAAVKGASHKLLIGIVAGLLMTGGAAGLYVWNQQKQPVQTAEVQSEKKEESPETLYKAYLEKELIPQMGVASVDILNDAADGYPLIYDEVDSLSRFWSSGTTRDESQWGFQPGIISVDYADMDGDSTDEMIVLENIASDTAMRVRAEIYYIKGNAVKKAAIADEAQGGSDELTLTHQMYYEMVKDEGGMVLKGAANEGGSYPVKPYPTVAYTYSGGKYKVEVTAEQNPEISLDYEPGSDENRQTFYYAELGIATLGYFIQTKDYTGFQEEYNPYYVKEGSDMLQEYSAADNAQFVKQYKQISENPQSFNSALSNILGFALIDLNQDGTLEFVTYSDIVAQGGMVYFPDKDGQLTWGDSIPMYELYYNPNQKKFFGMCERMDGVTVQEFQCDPLGPSGIYEFYNPSQGGNPYEYETEEHKEMIESFYDGHVYRVEYVDNTPENREKYLQGNGIPTPVNKTDAYIGSTN